jgi:pimeloyl-ACP methyl ester carboxylesterase
MVGVSLYYESMGSGEPLVLLHAGVADSSMWDDQVGPFAEHFRVIRFDAQGFGRSPAAAEPKPRAEDIFDLLTELGISRAHLIGVSMGGAAAIDFAITHPDMVGALIPVCAGASGFEADDPWLTEQDQLSEAAVARGDLEAATELDLRIWLAGPGRRVEDLDPTLRERADRMARLAQERDAERKPAPRIEPPAATRLGSITAPTLVVIGEHDVAYMQQVADYLAENIAGARKVVLHGTAHMPPIEVPDEFNRVVLEFLTTVAASAGARRS